MKRRYVSKNKDPYGGVYIFWNFSHLSLFRVFRLQTERGQIGCRFLGIGLVVLFSVSHNYVQRFLKKPNQKDF